MRCHPTSQANTTSAADEVCYVISNLTPGGPAERSQRILLGDLVLKINGHSLSSLSFDSVKTLVCGLPLTPITMTISSRTRLLSPMAPGSSVVLSSPGRWDGTHRDDEELHMGKVVVVHVPRMCAGRGLEGLVRLM